jgi:hypothetical protein
MAPLAQMYNSKNYNIMLEWLKTTGRRLRRGVCFLFAPLMIEYFVVVCEVAIKN